MQIFVLGHCLSLEGLNFRILEQTMSADKYPYSFPRQIGEIIYMALYGDVKFGRGKHMAI